MTDLPDLPPAPDEGPDDPWAWARGPEDAPVISTDPRDDWGWAHHEETDELPAVDPAAVTAVLVCHNAGDWLSRTLASLEALDPAPGKVVAVDTGSGDRTAEMLDQACENGAVDQVVQAGRVPGFGAAVAAGLRGLGGDENRWLWLLHDDVEIAPRALHALLVRASAEDSPTVLYPKLLQPRLRHRRDRIAEIGSSVTPGASRHLALSPGEVDQRQVDSRPVLGGSTAGMFVRRDVWDELGGLAPELPLFRDGQDFGWRANAAGHRVVTAPEATLYHRQEGRFGYRDSDLIDDPAATDRLLGMQMVAAHSARPARALAAMRRRARWRAAGYLLGKAPSEAASEWRAARRAGRLREPLAAMHATRGVPVDASLLPTRGQRWNARIERLQHALSAGWVERRELEGDTGLDDLLGDDFAGGRRTRRLVRPRAVLMVTMLALTLLAARELLGRGRLTSASLAPAPHSLGAAWSAWLHPTPGEVGLNAPWLGAMALGSTLTAGVPELFVRLLVLGAPLLGALTAHRLTRRLVGDTWLAMLLALMWPSLVLLTGATARGGISAAAATIVLPLVATAALAWRAQSDDLGLAERLRAPWTVAFWSGLLATTAPVYALLGPALALADIGRRRRLGAAALIGAFGPLLMIAPWWPRLVQHPARLLVGTDPTSGLTRRPVAAWQVLLGRGEVVGLPPLGVSAAATVALIVVLTMGVLQGYRKLPVGTVASLLVGANLALVAAAWLPRTLVTLDGMAVRPSAEPWLLMAAGCVLLLAAMALALPGTPAVGPASGAIITAVAALLVAALAATVAVLGAPESPMTVRRNPLPEYVADVQASPRATRTLVVMTEGSTHRWVLTSATVPQWGGGEHFPLFASAAQSDRVGTIAAQVAQGAPSDDIATRLAGLGVAHIVLDGGDPQTIAAVSNAAGLSASRAGEETIVWTVQGLTSRAGLTPTGGAFRSLPAAQVDAQGTVRIAELPDDRWVVRIDGHRVPVQADPSGFGLLAPTEGHTGHLTWATRIPWWLVALQVVVVIGILLLSAPTIRREGSRPHARRAPRRAA